MRQPILYTFGYSCAADPINQSACLLVYIIVVFSTSKYTETASANRRIPLSNEVGMQAAEAVLKHSGYAGDAQNPAWIRFGRVLRNNSSMVVLFWLNCN